MSKWRHHFSVFVFSAGVVRLSNRGEYCSKQPVIGNFPFIYPFHENRCFLDCVIVGLMKRQFERGDSVIFTWLIFFRSVVIHVSGDLIKIEDSDTLLIIAPFLYIFPFFQYVI